MTTVRCKRKFWTAEEVSSWELRSQKLPEGVGLLSKVYLVNTFPGFCGLSSCATSCALLCFPSAARGERFNLDDILSKAAVAQMLPTRCTAPSAHE